MLNRGEQFSVERLTVDLLVAIEEPRGCVHIHITTAATKSDTMAIS